MMLNKLRYIIITDSSFVLTTRLANLVSFLPTHIDVEFTGPNSEEYVFGLLGNDVARSRSISRYEPKEHSTGDTALLINEADLNEWLVGQQHRNFAVSKLFSDLLAGFGPIGVRETREDFVVMHAFSIEAYLGKEWSRNLIWGRARGAIICSFDSHLTSEGLSELYERVTKIEVREGPKQKVPRPSANENRIIIDAIGDNIARSTISPDHPCLSIIQLFRSVTSRIETIREAQQSYYELETSHLFDHEFYTQNYVHKNLEGADPLRHYVLYGDSSGFRASIEFDANYYRLVQPYFDRGGGNSLVSHLKNDGNAVPLIPTVLHLYNVALAEGIIDKEFYCKRWLHSQDEDLSIFRIQAELDGLGRQTSHTFAPNNIPVLKRHGQLPLGWSHYLTHFFREERMGNQLLRHLLTLEQFSSARNLTKFLISRYGMSLNYAETMAFAADRVFDWEESKYFWEEFQRRSKEGETRSRAMASLISYGGLNLDLETEIEPTGSPTSARLDLCEVVIYTTLFGDYDELPPISNALHGVRFICFSDKVQTALGWETILVEDQEKTPNLSAKRYKILPHKYLKQFKFSLFVDANIIFSGRLIELLNRCFMAGDFVMWRHPDRNCVYRELSTIIGHNRYKAAPVIQQVRHYHESGLPQNVGLVEASFIWRSHTNTFLNALMEKWWDHNLKWSSRDQLSLGFLLWSDGPKPRLLSDDLGTSRRNSFFAKVPHHRHRRRFRAFATVPQRRKVVFLYHEKAKHSGSSIMRGQQLCDILRQNIEECDFEYTSDVSAISEGAIVILTKGFLKHCEIGDLSTIAVKCTVLADFVDEPLRPDLVTFCDGVIASSQLALIDYRTKEWMPQTFHLTHHVDPRIDWNFKRPADFSTGYFGEAENTRLPDALRDSVEMVPISTKVRNTDWMAQVNRFNCHYAVRHDREIDGFKPFIKGFTAAHAGANIIIQRSAGDAVFYLGEDYPFLIDGEAGPNEIANVWQQAKDSFSTSVWRDALEIMKEVEFRSSINFIINEFRYILKEVG